MKSKLLAGMTPHKAEISAQIGKTLPVIAGHFADQRAFAVHDFVMRERQNEIFRECIKQPESQVVVVIIAMDGLFRHIIQSIVHPPHIPFIGEAKTAIGDWPADAGPRGRFLGDHNAFPDSAP